MSYDANHKESVDMLQSHEKIEEMVSGMPSLACRLWDAHGFGVCSLVTECHSCRFLRMRLALSLEGFFFLLYSISHLLLYLVHLLLLYLICVIILLIESGFHMDRLSVLFSCVFTYSCDH